MTVIDAPPVVMPDVDLAEKAVLAAMLASRRAAETLIEILPSADCFGSQIHRAVYDAVRYVTESGEPHEPPSVLKRLVAVEAGVWRTGQAGVILAGLAGYVTASYEAHARTVLNAAVRRRGEVALLQIADLLKDPAFDPEGGGDLARKLLDDALTVSGDNGAAVPVSELFVSSFERLEAGKQPGVVQVPWLDLRSLVPWLRPGQLVTIAARPSLGKSLLGQDIARHVAMRQHLPVILFTMEMDRDEVMDRLIAAESSVLLKRITDSTLDEDEWDRIAATSPRFADSKLIIDDTPQITLAHIRARLRGMARKDPAQVAIVDYLQLMDGAGGENRQQEVARLVSGLKAIAREFRIPVVMLCQLNRGPEARHDKRPYMSDARESGAVENDSDIAILIHRPDHYEAESPRAGEADLIVDKNRNGPRATVTVGFQGHYGRFVDLAPAHLAGGVR